MNYIYDFIDWIIQNYFLTQSNEGHFYPIVLNPFTRLSKSTSLTETVRTPLPYRYIQELRQILCPLPNLSNSETAQAAYSYCHFKHWIWAQQQSSYNGDWFEVDTHQIDKSDPDCVWRSKEVMKKGKKVEIFQIWSPVKAMLIFIKLHLPLRTYQIRFLDSGEADTWRYQSGQWIENIKHDFALGNIKRPYAKGIFKRIPDSISGRFLTGLYISTNKTADQNKDESNYGYTIPWQHEEVLYWLEKLRNWQEKYNPIYDQMPCTDLDQKHFGLTKSEHTKKQMGAICFLFRNASTNGSNRSKPISGDTYLSTFWYQLLLTLEKKLAQNRHLLSDGSFLKLVEEYPQGTVEGNKSTTLFPLHSLRVSLITAYTMDTALPLPVISKLLAGHTRLIMTIYYNKITPSVMAHKMEEAEQELNAKAAQSLRIFLKDASLEQIQAKIVYQNENSILTALANRNPIGWEYRAHGLCLVGGNTVKSDSAGTLGGCWNGGELINSADSKSKRKYEPVAHGPENCVRCRWFVTDASYLPALNAYFNQLSYKAHEAAHLALEIEKELDQLKDEKFFCEEQDFPFTKYKELQELQRRWEKQQVEADEFTKDWIATFSLIQKILYIEKQRVDSDFKDKLIAVGSEQDITHSIKFIETNSELLHLSLLCDDAEFYPDFLDSLRKTPAITKRTISLSRIMMNAGYEPIFMEMDEKMQLIAANAMIRKMAKIADPEDKLEGYRKVAGYLETNKYLKNHQLLDEGILELSDLKKIPIIVNKSLKIGGK